MTMAHAAEALPRIRADAPARLGEIVLAPATSAATRLIVTDFPCTAHALILAGRMPH